MANQSWVSQYRHFLGRRTFTALLPPAILLGILLLIVKWLVTPAIHHGSVWIADEPGFEFKWLDDHDIKLEISAVQDLRSLECKSMKYMHDELNGQSVSIVLTFHEHEFNNLKTTLESIIQYTPVHLYKEILLLDDGSVRDSVRKEAARLLIQARFNKVVVNEGWLEPLLNHVINDPTVLAVPHIDRLLKGRRFVEVEHGVINVFGWSLATYFYETDTRDMIINSPVMTGDAFVANKKFLEEIGSYDEGMENGNGETLELSLRTWMCGGSIQMVSCSRIAVKDALVPHNITSDRNFERISKLWFDNDYQQVIFKHHVSKSEMTIDEKDHLKMRQQYLKKITTCKDMEWYLENPGKAIVKPSNVLRFYNMGKLGNHAGVCVHGTIITGQDYVRADLCRPHMYDPEMIYEVDVLGHYSHQGNCLGMNDDHKVNLEACDQSSHAQIWTKYDHDMYFNMNYRDYCLTHISENNIYKLHVEICRQNPAEPPPQSYRWHVIQY